MLLIFLLIVVHAVYFKVHVYSRSEAQHFKTCDVNYRYVFGKLEDVLDEYGNQTCS